jgi:hypothetical protein
MQRAAKARQGYRMHNIRVHDAAGEEGNIRSKSSMVTLPEPMKVVPMSAQKGQQATPTITSGMLSASKARTRNRFSVPWR